MATIRALRENESPRLDRGVFEDETCMTNGESFVSAFVFDIGAVKRDGRVRRRECLVLGIGDVKRRVALRCPFERQRSTRARVGDGRGFRARATSEGATGSDGRERKRAFDLRLDSEGCVERRHGGEEIRVDERILNNDGGGRERHPANGHRFRCFGFLQGERVGACDNHLVRYLDIGVKVERRVALEVDDDIVRIGGRGRAVPVRRRRPFDVGCVHFANRQDGRFRLVPRRDNLNGGDTGAGDVGGFGMRGDDGQVARQIADAKRVDAILRLARQSRRVAPRRIPHLGAKRVLRVEGVVRAVDGGRQKGSVVRARREVDDDVILAVRILVREVRHLDFKAIVVSIFKEAVQEGGLATHSVPNLFGRPLDLRLGGGGGRRATPRAFGVIGARVAVRVSAVRVSVGVRRVLDSERKDVFDLAALRVFGSAIKPNGVFKGVNRSLHRAVRVLGDGGCAAPTCARGSVVERKADAEGALGGGRAGVGIGGQRIFGKADERGERGDQTE